MGNAESSSQEDVFRASMDPVSAAKNTRESLMGGSPMARSSRVRAPTREEDGVDDKDVTMRLSIAETEVKRRESTVKSVLANMRPEQTELPSVQSYIPHILSDAIFCGHLVTDLDSIARYLSLLCSPLYPLLSSALLSSPLLSSTSLCTLVLS